MNWNKLSKVLPPTVKEEEFETKDLFEMGMVSLIHNKISKTVLLKSPDFEKFCEDNWLVGGDSDFRSKFLIGYITTEDILEGKYPEEDKNHKLYLSILGLDGDIGNSNIIWENIEWIDMDQLDEA